MPTPFYTGYFQVNWMTQGIYDAIKDNVSPYQLYLMQDTNNAYLGTTRLFDVFHLVDSFDEPYRGDIKPKSLCVKLTQGEDGAPFIEAKILQEDYTFTELVPPIMGEIVDEDLPEDRTVPTRRAVWKFVDDRLVALQEYFDALENRVVGYMERAETAAVNAEASETAATNSATAADNSATESESYAHGGTGTRQGEDTDNSKHYMEEAQAAASQGGGSAEEARRQAEAAAASAADALQSEQNAKASENAAALSEQKAHGSEVDAAASAVAAAGSAADAAASAVEAHASEVNAAGSETAASTSAGEAAGSARDAATSAGEAAQSELNAATSESEAAASAASALTSEGKAKTSEQNAAQSEANALSYKNAASGSATDAASSVAAALSSEQKAKQSETNAANSATAASNSASAAQSSQNLAAASKNEAAASAAAALASEQNAATSEIAASHSESEAASSEAAAEASEQAAAGSATLAESWAVGGTGTRTGEDTNNAEYWAEQARQASPDGKADKVLNATAGDLAGLDSTGNLTDSGIPSDNVALQDGSYDTLHAGTAGNLVDDRAPSTNRKFGFDTACGDVSISDEGTADPTLLKGTTYVKNQLVGDSKVVKELGQGVVTSPVAVAGDIDHAYIKGRSLVRNQLVPASVEKEGSSATGVVEVSDAVADDALALRMTAPRSVVVNQQLPTADIANWKVYNSSYGTLTAENGELTYECISTEAPYLYSYGLRKTAQNEPPAVGHVYACIFDWKVSNTGLDKVTLDSGLGVSSSTDTTYPTITLTGITVNTWINHLFMKGIGRSYGSLSGLIYPVSSNGAATLSTWAIGDTYSIRNYMLVDLTAYFNGDQTLINSIQSWDDLVAYDPRFASYVAYNTGTVEGVQPQVKVSGKNLANPQFFLDNGGVLQEDGSYYFATASNLNNKEIFVNVSQYTGQITVKYDVKYLSTATAVGAYVRIIYTDGTQDAMEGNSGYGVFLTKSKTSNAQKTVRSIRFTYNTGSTSTWFKNFQIEFGSTATSYEPYHDGGTAQAPAPLFAVGNAADEFEAVSGVVTRNVVTYTFTENTNWRWYPASNCWQFEINAKTSVRECILVGYIYVNSVASDTSFPQRMTMPQHGRFVYVYDANYVSSDDLEAFKAHMAGKTLYLSATPPTTSTSTPTQISLQAGTNVAMQTDGGRTASSLALGYDGTSFDVPLKTGRSYLVKKGSTSTLVTDGTTQSVTGGQDMIVDLNTLYNNVSSLITPIADWNALVSDTGMYGSYTAYDEGTVVHSDQTEVKVTGKNLFDAENTQSSNNFLTRLTVTSGTGYKQYTAITNMTSGSFGYLYPLRLVTSADVGKTYSMSFTPYLNGVLTNGYAGYSAVLVASNSDMTNPIPPYNTLTANSYINGKRLVQGVTSITASDVGKVLIVRLYVSVSSTYPMNAGDVIKYDDIQVELGSSATSYEPYFDGGTATAGLLKGVPGSVYDQLDAITGNVTTRIGSYTFTGNEAWTASSSVGTGAFYTQAITNAYRLPANSTVMSFTLAGYTPKAAINSLSEDKVFNLNSASQMSTTNVFMVKDTSCSTTTEIAAKMAGKTVYYRLATYTKSTTTPQPLTQPTGGLTVLQTAGTLPVPLDVRHAVSEWDEPIVRNCKYIFRDNGEDSLVTGSTTVTYKHVVGGEHKLINLTQWFGRNREPSIADFYKLFPTWKDADIPYDRGTVLNYKGTGVRTIGFNAYNNATGTAVLLGGNQYQICGTYTSCTYADQWGNAEELDIDDKGIFTPVNNGTLTVVGGNDTDTCVHLCWSGYKDYGKPDYEWFPYEEKGVSWDLSPWFPNGMNALSTNLTNTYQSVDSITGNEATVATGRLVLDGSENWIDYVYQDVYRGFQISSYLPVVWRKPACVCNFGIQAVRSNNMDGSCASVWMGTDTGSKVMYIVWDKRKVTGTNDGLFESCYDPEADILDVDAFKEYLQNNPIEVIYSLDDGTVHDIHTVPVTPTQNFSYPVNDFGTEQSLPVNTLTLLTTDLDAEIRYSLDFTRTVANYSKIEGDVKQLVDEKDNLARQDGNYGDKGGVFNYATQLLDPNALPTEASYGNRTAAGDVSIADNGTADVTSLQGTTQIQNQLVHDTNMNTKSSVDGRLVLTDAVGGQLSRLEIHGGCVVHNQLVKESIEKTASGTGRLGVEDGVAGNAKSLVMTAPRSVVMNQLNNIPASDRSTTKNNVTITDNRDGTYTVSTTTEGASADTDVAVFGVNINGPDTIAGHAYLAFGAPSGVSNITYYLVDSYGNHSVTSVQGNKFTPSSNSHWKPYIRVKAGAVITTPVKFAPQLVDLTQYFNGNTTLINSINTWDDLVAYDSAFASYVPYDTGTVKGVTPTVKVNHATDVACPAELFGVSDTVGDSFDGVSGVVTRNVGSYTFTGEESWSSASGSGIVVFQYAIGSMRTGSTNGVLPGYIPTTASWQSMPDKSVKFFSNNNQQWMYVRDASYTSVSDFKASMSGKTVYYELATPTTTQYNPTTIPTLDIYNTALQTAGTRQCSLSLTYDGKDQTIALNPSHTYVFNDNQEDDSLITGQSSIEVVGGEDQLVDITQLYNGDTTKIANIHSWASLSTRFHRYRDFLPYNPGTVEPDCPVIRKFNNEHAYGIIYDPSQNTPACQWVELNNGVLTEVASFADFREIPCHQLYRCVMSDLANRTIAYYLDDEDSDKKYNGTRNGVTSDGTASVLTGADGDVETEMPIGYWDLDEDWEGTGKRLWLISDRPFMGSYYPAEIHDFFYVSPDGSTPRKQYVGSYRGCICDADGNPLNTTEGALSQVTGTASTNKVRSIKGALPYVNVSLNDFTVKSGRNGGSSVNVKYHQWLFLLMAIEQGSLDNQAISYGYAGGIQNAFCFWRKSGRVNAGNGTAELKAVEGTQDMDNFQKFTIGSTTVQRDTLRDADGRYAWSVYNRNASSTRYFTSSPTPANGDPVYTASTGTTTAGTVASYTLQSNRTIQFQYRGIENPFGEVWEFEHGIQKFQTGSLKSFRGTDNLTYTRDPLSDGPSSYAWKNTSDTVLWTNTAAPGTSTTMYSDSSLTTSVTTKYKDQPVYRYSSEGYWETLATSDYTMTDQWSAANPVYTVRHNHWPLSGWDTKFDPVTFFMKKTGSPGAGGRYLPDYWYNDGTVGDRVACVGGAAAHGSYDGLGYRYLNTGLATSSVLFSGRPSA